jgi:hypothetical protein
MFERATLTLAILFCSAQALADIPPPRTATAPLVGRWEWKSAKGDCVETHQYLSNGVKISHSGQEVIEKRYSLSTVRGASGPAQYVVTETTTRTNGKPDCLGNLAKLGHTLQLYLFFEGAQNYTTCATSSRSTCYGSATRLE